MTNQSEIDKAVSLLRNEGYKIEKEKLEVLGVSMTPDVGIYTIKLSQHIPFEQLHLIKKAIESGFNDVRQNGQRDEVAIRELLAASIERSQKIEKEATEAIGKAYIDFIDNLNNYKYF